MTSTSTRAAAAPRLLASLVGLVTLGSGSLLAACSSSPDGADATRPAPTVTTTGPAGAGTPPGPEATGANPADPAPVAPASCTAIELVEGTAVTSDALATCLADHMRWAGSGHEEIRLAGTTTLVDWVLTPEGLHGVLDRDPGGRVAFTPDRGWQQDGTGWVEGDPGGDSEAALVAQGVDILRTSLEPEFLAAMIRLAPGFTVAGREEVELADGTTTTLWAIRADAPFASLAQSTTDELVVWTATPGPTARIDITSTTPGAGQGTSTTFFTRWGQRPDLTELAELAGLDLGAGSSPERRD
ncbi:hypothetical protein [Cellulomonas sp. PSBB021]|uniref:hypothetical protein n=1 Tax=Cellulomonas sp. PSBB021 TaxID=2003551 RepID=UPI000B8D800E|nr:hypothetical protein [Cellulomonas sp. PSBB021]ASR55910.1 hypothetical protein CBP52_13300 [Cellulomonas sp. PSBB021]